MDTEKYIPYDETMYPTIEEDNLNSEELSVIKLFIELSNMIEDTNQLYKCFLFNREQLIFYYVFYFNDTYAPKQNNYFDDRILINSLTINYISAAVNLVEAQRKFAKIYNIMEFEKYCNDIYDESFHYRLMCFLRNYSQHGHFPVSVDKNNHSCCFDLQQIYNTMHFDKAKKIEQELLQLIQEITTKYRDNANIVYTKTMAVLEKFILKINVMFYKMFENLYMDTANQSLKIRNKLNKKKSEGKNFIVFAENETLHICKPNCKSKKYFKKLKKEAINELKNLKW